MGAMTVPVTTAPHEVRFQFGKNWTRFLLILTEERIADATHSLTDMLQITDLRGHSFLDVGSGSGLFSLAAMRLGASRVHSFDRDADSVACTGELKRRFFHDDANWTVQQGSVLDAAYLRTLGAFDIVYSWGVLHHTGDMWRALANLTQLVSPGGRLFVAIYNDQGSASRRWRTIKRLYNNGSWLVRPTLLFTVGAYFAGRAVVGRLLRGANPLSVAGSREAAGERRGMSRWYDLVDWVGGYPFEVAKPEEVFDFCRTQGFALQRLKTAGGGLGNNQFVFVRQT